MRWPLNFLFVIVFTSAGAQEKLQSPLLAAISKLSSESYPERMGAAKEVLKLSKPDPVAAGALLLARSRIDPDPEIRLQTSQLLRELFEFEILGKGSIEVGFELGWFVEDTGKEIVTLPYIIRIDGKGPAAKGGVKLGDVITHLNEEPLRKLDGRRLLLSKLARLESGKEVTFKIQRNPHTTDNELFHRYEGASVTFMPETRDPHAAGDPFPEERFKSWIESLERP